MTPDRLRPFYCEMGGLASLTHVNIAVIGGLFHRYIQARRHLSEHAFVAWAQSVSHRAGS
jgi:hypothetical protein